MTQTQRILAHLKAGHSITPLEALNLYGCMRLGARIADIKALGWKVNSEMVKGDNGKRFAKYTLNREGEQTKMQFNTKQPYTLDRKESN